MMGIDTRPSVVTREQYAAIFAREQAQRYPSVDALEQRLGYAIDRSRLEEAARVLSCPFKAAPPNWQHGRVIYAAVRTRIAGLSPDAYYRHVDIGTAKGFSALCARWAIDDGGLVGDVDSIDVLPQRQPVRRNTVAEVDELQILADVLTPWPEAARITFHETTGIDFLTRTHYRLHSVFVDGKHSKIAVSAEWRAIAERQVAGDLAIFDDVQMPQVAAGLKGATAVYEFETLALGTVNRAYAIGVRR